MAEQSAPSIPQVVAPTAGEIGGNVVKQTPQFGRVAGEAGGESQMAGLQDLVSLFLTDGRLALNNEIKTGLDSVTASVNKVTKPIQNKLNTLQGKMTNWETTVSRLEAKQAAGEALTKQETRALAAAKKNITKNSGKVDEWQGQIDAQNARIEDYMTTKVETAPTLTSLINEKFPEFQRALTAAQPYLNQMGTLGPAGERLMSALSAGYQANNVSAREIQAAQASLPADVRATSIQGVKMGDFGSAQAVRAADVANVGQGALGQSLMGEAQRRVALQGRLDPQATRDAVQSARQAFAARGMASGNAALGAELLNRDRYSRQRAFEDLGFAQQVQGQDLSRQFQNQQTQLGVSLANQQAAMQAEIANLQARYNQAVQEGDWAMAAQTANQKATLEADISNQKTAADINMYNVGQTNAAATNSANLALAADQFNETNRLDATKMDATLLADAYNLQQGVRDEGLRGVDMAFAYESAANPNNIMMNMYNAQPNYGGDALATAGNVANTAAALGVEAQGFNANSAATTAYINSNNRASLGAANIMASASRDAGTLGLVGGVAGGVVTGVGIAI